MTSFWLINYDDTDADNDEAAKKEDDSSRNDEDGSESDDIDVWTMIEMAAEKKVTMGINIEVHNDSTNTPWAARSPGPKKKGDTKAAWCTPRPPTSRERRVHMIQRYHKNTT